ncbi:unnamed protein product [Amoebophrya sp. A25]|nr:unnamed protein product [Amoebophrya sp. A25]|eukprot:GSA25T00007145001.1
MAAAFCILEKDITNLKAQWQCTVCPPSLQPAGLSQMSSSMQQQLHSIISLGGTTMDTDLQKIKLKPTPSSLKLKPTSTTITTTTTTTTTPTPSTAASRSRTVDEDTDHEERSDDSIICPSIPEERTWTLLLGDQEAFDAASRGQQIAVFEHQHQDQVNGLGVGREHDQDSSLRFLSVTWCMHLEARRSSKVSNASSTTAGSSADEQDEQGNKNNSHSTRQTTTTSASRTSTSTTKSNKFYSMMRKLFFSTSLMKICGTSQEEHLVQCSQQQVEKRPCEPPAAVHQLSMSEVPKSDDPEKTLLPTTLACMRSSVINAREESESAHRRSHLLRDD